MESDCDLWIINPIDEHDVLLKKQRITSQTVCMLTRRAHQGLHNSCSFMWLDGGNTVDADVKTLLGHMNAERRDQACEPNLYEDSIRRASLVDST